MIPNLRIHFGTKEGELSAISSYFDACYKPTWLESKLAMDILEDISGMVRIDGESIYVKDFFSDGIISISPRGLSQGVKALLVLLNTDEEFVRGSLCGENCAKWIIEISKIKPVTITLSYLMPFREDIDILVLNNNNIIHTYSEYLDEFAKVLKAHKGESLCYL